MDKTTLRKFKRLPVYVVEDHNDVIPYIYRCIGSRHLPVSGIKMYHIDAHPDLLIPSEFQADDVFDKEKLIRSLSIENWIMPAVYAGHIESVTWLKPPWAQQIHDQSTHFTVGKENAHGNIRLTSKESYFLSELLYSHSDNLLNVKKLNLSVVTLSPSDLDKEANCLDCEQEFNLNSILDIDLDFFSTANPFKELFSEFQYSLLKKLFKFEPPTDFSNSTIDECISKRRELLANIKSILAESITSVDVCNPSNQDSTIRKLIRELITDLSSTNREIDVQLLMLAGSTCDDESELPHHISSDSEIESMVKIVEWYLRSIPRPTIITVARSSIDGYCPEHQVEAIQSRVLELLAKMYGDIEVNIGYEQD